MIRKYHIVLLFFLVTACNYKRPIGRNYNNTTVYFKSDVANFEIIKHKGEPYRTFIRFSGQVMQLSSDSICWSDDKGVYRILLKNNDLRVFTDTIKTYTFNNGEWKLVK